MRRIVLWIPALLALALLGACDDGDGAAGNGGNGATAGPTATLFQSPTPGGDMPTPAPSIRDTDLGERPEIQEFIAAAGAVEVRQVQFVDLTNDGAEDAVLWVSSGGEGGDIAIFVFGYGPGGLQELLRVLPEGGRLTAQVIGDQLTVIEPLFAEGDPMCCPSQERVTKYAWDGNALIVVEETVLP